MDEPLSFGEHVRALVLDHAPQYRKGGANVNWAKLNRDLPLGIRPDTLRKIVAGERRPSIPLMEAVAAVLGVPAETFAEYRLATARELLDPEAQGGGKNGLRIALESLERLGAR